MNTLENNKLIGETNSKQYAITISNGHDEDWEYFNEKEDAEVRFTSLKSLIWEHESIHMYKYNKELGYEVVDSYSIEEE